MIEVVLHLVVLRKAPQVRRLHLDEVIHGRLPNRKSHGVKLTETGTKITSRSRTVQLRSDALSPARSLHCRKNRGSEMEALYVRVPQKNDKSYPPPCARKLVPVSRGVAGSDRRLSRSLATRVKGNSLKGAGKSEGSCLA